MLVINFKTYQESTGDNAVKLAKVCEKVAKSEKVEVIPCVDAVDLYRVSHAVKIPVFAQSADADEFGAHTGSILIDCLKSAGAIGTLVNHSENRVPFETIKKVVEACKKKKFKVLVCAQDAEEVSKIAELKPDYIAYEPPELIGGDISVSTAKPEVIEDSVKNSKKVPLLVGAGVKNSKDVSISTKLGAKGVLVASGVVKAADPEKALKDLASGL